MQLEEYPHTLTLRMGFKDDEDENFYRSMSRLKLYSDSEKIFAFAQAVASLTDGELFAVNLISNTELVEVPTFED
ncbi:hypothetical protein B0H94_12026 [Salsuginibacillus halophilus]|uniref:DUF1659 domain-containing protein n=1 Tax=Salsuginibacillus halophilus TaxID=517424 RepID=A0A2P8H508_9BACI|nr:hypothetical protein [Salsuginibacillus halophilus]PSL41280.1 hypothetical protein B0H94_12026 [Salsuginibacillus halophilus]